MRRLIVSALGRVCLFGEHMDWSSFYVVPAADDMRVFLRLPQAVGLVLSRCSRTLLSTGTLCSI